MKLTENFNLLSESECLVESTDMETDISYSMYLVF